MMPRRLPRDHQHHRFVPVDLYSVRRKDGAQFEILLEAHSVRAMEMWDGVTAVERLQSERGSVAQVVIDAYTAKQNSTISRRHARKHRKAYRAAKRLEGSSTWARAHMRELRLRKTFFRSIDTLALDQVSQILQHEREIFTTWSATDVFGNVYDTTPFDGGTRNLQHALRLCERAGEHHRPEVVASVKADVQGVVFYFGADPAAAAWRALLADRSRCRANRRLATSGRGSAS